MWMCLQTQKIVCPGQESDDRVMFGQLQDVVVAEMVHMIERGGVEAEKGLQSGARKLAHVGSHAQTMLLGSLENLRRLLGRKCAFVAEHIRELSELPPRCRGNHLFTDGLNVLL